MTHEHDPLAPHSHDPNPEPPGEDAGIILQLPDGKSREITVADLKTMPYSTLPNSYILSTGHPATGPFDFGGVSLFDFLMHFEIGQCENYTIEVVSGDGFGTRVQGSELTIETDRPLLLTYEIDGTPLTRQQGLVRLIVPTEIDDALRQVKWIGEIRIVS